MVRGICSRLCVAFGHHTSTGFTADQLFPLVWEATRILECIGFKLRAWVCDGASPNCKFLKINHLGQGAGIVYSTINRFEPSRKIYFISDVPHLLKTTRNNSHGKQSWKLKYKEFICKLDYRLLICSLFHIALC